MPQTDEQSAESCSSSSSSGGGSPRDDGNRWRLRGLLWRMQLGVLPCHFDSVDALRRAAADGRRRYADLRRKLLVDPHLMDEGQKSPKPPDVGMDNPLSLDPDSVWGKYFRNAEIERTIDKDLSRLYPEHDGFFQTNSCQAMLRRILLVWSLLHPQLSYRQGMHELLAPLLYVLHVDVLHLSQIKSKNGDLFDDRFDEDVKASRLKLPLDLAETTTGQREPRDHEELNVDLKVLVMGSDMYGAEGELGALFSPRFMEHDAYCMFDALLGGRGGAVRMVDYFAVSGVPDASAALYRTLAAADISLYTHFVELGVQPQYFALRWLRLLFGREFVLEDLLLVWDTIYSASNEVIQQEVDDGSGTVVSSRSALISAIAVSILLHSRPALLAAPDATGCLQRLLSSPHIPDVSKFLENAKLLQPLAAAAARTPPPPVAKHSRSPSKPQNRSTAPCSPELLKLFLAEGYWEGKWRTSVLSKSASEDAARLSKVKTSLESKGRKAPPLQKSRTMETGSEINSDEDATPPRVADSSSSENGDGACADISNREPLVQHKVVAEEVKQSVKPAETENSVKTTPTLNSGTPNSNSGGTKSRLVPVVPPVVSTRDVVVGVDDPLGAGTSGTTTTTSIRRGGSIPGSVSSPRTGSASPRTDSVMTTLRRAPSLTSKVDEILEAPKKFKATVATQSLGQAMVENIQVLESVLTQKAKEGDHFSKTFLGSNGHVSAMVALTELRKISNALLQM